jgi:hypothetical protein
MLSRRRRRELMAAVYATNDCLGRDKNLPPHEALDTPSCCSMPFLRSGRPEFNTGVVPEDTAGGHA